jgi:hypothetical protein
MISVPLPVLALPPDFGVIANVGKLGAYFDVVASRDYAAAHQRGHTQIIADPLDVNILPFVTEDGVARLHL